MDKIISLGREMTDVLREKTMLYNPNLEIIQIENLGDINSIYPFDMFRYGKWNEAAKVPIGLSGPAALYDFIYGDQIIDEKEYMEKVYPTRRELEYTYVRKAGIFYDLKMIVYTVVCILYAVCGKECTWMLNEFVEDAKMTMNK